MSIPQLMAAVKAKLGQYTTTEIKTITAALQAPILGDFTAHLTQQTHLHAVLATAEQPLSECVKIDYYQVAMSTHPGATTAIDDWLKAKPELADQHFADLEAHMRKQESNITRGPTLTHAGYAPAIASLAAAALAAVASPQHGALTQAELSALRAIIQQQQPTKPTITDTRGDRSGRQRGGKYCAIHGHGHSGLECRTMAADTVKYAAARVITAADQVTPAIAALRAAAPRRDPRPTA
jgi:hypothetical protein